MGRGKCIIVLVDRGRTQTLGTH